MTDRSLDRAQAESLGSLLLVAVVVVSGATFGAYYVASTGGGGAGGSAGSAGGAAGSTVDLTLSATEDALRLSHNGGPSYGIGTLRVTVRNDSGEFAYAFSDGQIRDGGDANGQFDPGETWRLGWRQPAGESVTVAVVNADSETLVLRQTTTVESATVGESRESAEGTDTSEAVVGVDAGPRRTVSGESGSSVALDGTVNGSANDLGYDWEITDDDGVATEAVGLTDETTTDPTFNVYENVTDNHTVEVEFTASNDTASGADRTAVVIEGFNRPPVADAGEDREWDGDGEDSDEDRDRDDDGDGDDDGDDDSNDGGDEEEDDSDALANPVTVPGAAVIYPPGVDAGLPDDTDDDTELDDPSVELNGTGSYDPEGGELQYEWTVTGRDGFDSDALDLLDAQSATPRVVLRSLPESERRNVTVELTVTDPEGATDTDRVNVTVHPEAEEEDESLRDVLEELWESLFGGNVGDDGDDGGDGEDRDDRGDEGRGGWSVPWPFR
jgi:hypothetical protein